VPEKEEGACQYKGLNCIGKWREGGFGAGIAVEETRHL